MSLSPLLEELDENLLAARGFLRRICELCDSRRPAGKETRGRGKYRKGPLPGLPALASYSLSSRKPILILTVALSTEIVEFLAGLDGRVIQGIASEAILVSLLVARDKILRKDGNEYLSKLIIYASNQTHSALKKACQNKFGDIAGLITPEK
ncbi:Tyrosine decarboxylase 1 [Platanthera zijinensis]|uniref:Tyrosine decarboxylase 1 n=1 Tax=Platanthera zijinensis TaxID=2320716 RepID=A0AAP0B6Q3_9ASPA